jgi:hypothetical protein
MLLSSVSAGQGIAQRSEADTGGMEMEIASGHDGLICRGDEVEKPINEQRLWAAVLAQALEDWRGDRISLRRDAEQFLFEDQKDFDIVCARAGIDPSSLRARLQRMRGERVTRPVRLAA